MIRYEKPAEWHGGLRLHQNEHTGGCSPRVLEALTTLTREQVGCYPPYLAATAACARHFGVDPEWLSLVNGLDEGIMATAVGYLRPRAASGAGRVFMPEAVIPEPAFEIFGFDTEVVGGAIVSVAPRPDFAFPLDEVLAAITPHTRVVFLTNPNNPTGVSMPLDAIGVIARRIPAGAVVFADEAYAEFSGATFLPRLGDFPNVIVGRTFSKAYGLAGLRIGAVIGHPAALEPLRLAIPVYSVNVAAVVAMHAAIADREYVAAYLDEVAQSKAMMYDTCDRLSLGYVRSDANFVFIRAGVYLEPLRATARAHGLHLRQREADAASEGYLRVSAGRVEDTRRFLRVLEEVVCAVES